MKNKYRGVYDLSESKNLTEDKRTECIVFSGKEIATVTSFEAALEEAIMAYNLSI